MKLSRRQLRGLIVESYGKGGYVHPNDPKHQRNREAYDGDGPGDPAMRGVYGDPNEKLRGSTIEYPGGKKAFLQSMIDTYRSVGMHEEADRTQAELDAMTDDVFKATLEESWHRLTEDADGDKLSDEDMEKYYDSSVDEGEDLSIADFVLKILKEGLSGQEYGRYEFKMTRDASRADVAKIEAINLDANETLFTVQFNP